MTLRGAADALGVSDPAVHDWIHGSTRPRTHHRESLEVWTKGEVPRDSWLRDDERVAKAAVRPFSPGE